MCRWAAHELSAAFREDEVLIAMGCPVLAQELQGGIGQRHIAVFGTLPAVDVDRHPGAVDV
jgi:hypothetical protein